MWVSCLGRDSRRREGRRVCNACVASALVDEGRPAARTTIQLEAVWVPAFGQLIRAITHALQPLTGLERSRARLQPFGDLADAPRASQVGAEPGQPVIDDMRVRIVEAGQHARTPKVDHSRSWPAQAHDL